MGRKSRKERKAARGERRQQRRDNRTQKQAERETKRKDRQQDRRDNQDDRRENRQDRRETRRDNRAVKQQERRENQNTRRSDRRKRREERRENRQEKVDSIFGESDRRNARRDRQDGRRDERHDRQDSRRDNRRENQDDRRERRTDRRENRQEKRDQRLDERRARQDARRQRREDRRETRRPLNVEYWSTLEEGHTFPEEELSEVMLRPNAGIAFSGGGSRSAVASFGTMRALHQMGLDKEFRYIGANSGGAWFVSAYSFLPEELTDEEFFGDYLDFSTISNFDQVRDSVDSSAFLRAMTYGGIGRKALHGFKGYFNNRDENWARAIGQSILAPLGLFESMHPSDSQLEPGSESRRRSWDHIKWFTWSDETLDDIIEDNPHLEEDDFDVARPNRPFPIIVGALAEVGVTKRFSGDTGHALNHNQDLFLDHFEGYPFEDGDCDEDIEMNGENLPWEDMSLLEMTPLYTGVRMQDGRRGGYYVESFAFDSQLRHVRSGNEAVIDSRFLSFNNSGRSQRFSISDMMSITGSAMGWLAQGFPGKRFGEKIVGDAVVDGLASFKSKFGFGTLDFQMIEDISCPAVSYWQPHIHDVGHDVNRTQTGVSRAIDGGVMDNFGLTPLLMRGVEKIVMCMNSAERIREDPGHIELEELLPNIEHFFGVVDRVSDSTGWGSRGRNQVFENTPSDPNFDGDCIDEILEGIQKNRQQYGVSFFSSKYRVVENPNYGIKPYDVEVFWYFTETSEKSDIVIDRLEDDYDNILGYETTEEDFDLGYLFAKAARIGVDIATLQFGKAAAKAAGPAIVHGFANSITTSEMAANSIFSEEWTNGIMNKIASGDDGIARMFANQGFPHYNTHVRISLSAEEVGLLANYTHWSFLQLESHLRAFLDGTPIGTPVGPDVLESRKGGSFRRRSMRSPAEMGRKKDRIRIRQEDRIDDREFYGDADLELNEDLAFEDEEAAIENRVSIRQDTTSYGIRNVRGQGSSSSIKLRNAIATQDYDVDISNMAEDPDEDDIMTFSKVSGPAWLKVDGEGRVWGKPSSSDIGPNRFTLRVTDLEGEFSDAEVEIIVDSGNRPPRWKADLS